MLRGGISRRKEFSMNITPGQVLTWGIVAAATCGTGVLGIIFGIIGRKKVNQYLLENNGVTCGQVKAGSITSKVGLIVGIVMTVFWVIYAIIAIVAIAALSQM